MRKIAAVMMLVFLISFAVGTMFQAEEAQARKQIPCTYRCINQDTYLCCYYPLLGEVCTWDHTGCP